MAHPGPRKRALLRTVVSKPSVYTFPTPASANRSLPNRLSAGSHPYPCFQFNTDPPAPRAAPLRRRKPRAPPLFQCFWFSYSRAAALACCSVAELPIVFNAVIPGPLRRRNAAAWCCISARVLGSGFFTAYGSRGLKGEVRSEGA